MVRIIVKSLTGWSINLDVDTTNDTVDNLKHIIYEKNPDFPVEVQRLIAFGKLLKDDQTLDQYNICTHSTIHVVVPQGYSAGGGNGGQGDGQGEAMTGEAQPQEATPP